MPEATAMKVHTEEERTTLRAILASSGNEWKECPCGWFYIGHCCPDKACTESPAKG